MTVKVTKPSINLREKLSELDKPSGIAGQDILKADTPQEVFNYIGAGRRNLIINGAMQVWQRGTSFTGTYGYTADRFYHSVSGGTLTAASQQTLPLGQTDLPSQFRTFLRYDMSAGNNNSGVFHKIEDVDCVEGQVTFSVYAKGTNPSGGKFTFNFQQNFGSGGSTSVTVQDVADIVVTSSWQRFTVTFTLPSLSGKTKGTGSYLYVWITQPDGDTGTGAYTLDTTGWQLEVGSVATPFEHRSYGEELALCQRYFYNIVPTSSNQFFGDARGENANEIVAHVVFPVTMRAVPTGSYSGSVSDNTFNGTTNLTGASSVLYSALWASTRGAAFNFSQSSTVSNGTYTWLSGGSYTFVPEFDAEL